MSSEKTPLLEVRSAMEDAIAGWKYIRKNHGDLYGVGWDRVEKRLAASIAAVSKSIEKAA